MVVKPITPQEAAGHKLAVIPDRVIKVFNDLIALKFNGRSATVKQDDILKALDVEGLARQTVFDNGWLDVEPIYREAGWGVEYDRPGFCEEYPATFKFTKKGG